MNKGILKKILAMILVWSMLLSSDGMMNLQVNAEKQTGNIESVGTSEDSSVTTESDEPSTEDANATTVDPNEPDGTTQTATLLPDEETATSQDRETEITPDNEIQTNAVQLQVDDDQAIEVQSVEADRSVGTLLPVKDDGSLGDINQSVVYYIVNFQQWLALAEYSKEHDLEGYRFSFSLNNSDAASENSPVYDFTSLSESFMGLGSEAYPFAGKLFTDYTAGTITFRMNTPLFSYLSSKADISGVRIECSKTSAGLAQYLIADASSMITAYSDITIVETSETSGVTSASDVAGGLFAHVINNESDALKIQGSGIAVSTVVSGKIAGGLIGEIKGNITLDLSGISMHTPGANGSDTTVYSYTTSTTAGTAIGGLIGQIGSVDDSSNAKVTITGNSAFVYTHRKKEFTGNANYSGGFIGKISDVDVEIDCPLSYVSGEGKNEIIGEHVGVFAGAIEHASITLNQQITCKNVAVSLPNSVRAAYGSAGMFAGMLTASDVKVGDAWTGTDPAFYVTSDIKERNNITNLSNTSSDNVGGFVGYVQDSNVQFTDAHPCKIENFRTDNTRGNVSSGIGKLETDKDAVTVQYIQVTGKYARLVGKNASATDETPVAQRGTVGGIAGYVYMGDGSVTIQNCDVTLTDYFYVFPSTIAYMSTGIGAVEANSASDAAITLQDLNCEVVLKDESHGGTNHYNVIGYGGAIGLADADFVIRGSNKFVLKTTLFSCSSCSPDYYGGVVGEVSGPTDGKRKGSISNVTVGICSFRCVKKARGGFVGFAGKNCAVAFAGTLKTEGIDSPNKVSCDVSHMSSNGAIVGAIDNALIFMEPDTDYQKNQYQTIDEIGNYGGVVRNGNWDGTGDTGKKLIENFQVTGTLTSTIATVGDLMRFAIVMNTQGAFMPEGNLESSDMNTIDAVRQSTYRLTGDTYDLTETGVMCLGRNDKRGIEETPFAGAFIGKDGQSTITYQITTNNQEYIGLFPKVAGSEAATVNFRNLKLVYTLSYKQYQAMVGNIQTYTLPQTEYVGGLAAVAEGDLNVTNVSYEGSIVDATNSKWDGTKQQFVSVRNSPKEDDYLGGIFGVYQGGTLTLDQIQAKMQHTYNNFTHVMGGVIGYVDLSNSTESDPCKIRIGSETGEVTLAGSITAAVPIPAGMTSTDYSIRNGGLIGEIGEQKQRDNYSVKCKLVIDRLNVEGLSIISKNKEYKETGGFLGYSWKDVDVSFSNSKVGVTSNSSIDAKAAFGGLIHTVCGKMLADQVTIGSHTQFFSYKDSIQIDKCGLLIRDGRYLYLDVRDYQVEDNVKLTNYPGTSFDEIVGFTKGGDDEQHGGIVSIGRNDGASYYLGRNNRAYESYQSVHVVNESNSVREQSNANTRYYYDLNKTDWTESVTSSISDAEKLLRWNVLHYANSGIRSFIAPGYQSLPTEYTLSKNIDLSGYSIYPVGVSGESYNGGTITFDAQSMISGEASMTQPKYPEDLACQHAQMQSGLFADVTGLTVKDMKLTGTYSKTGASDDQSLAGALVAGTICGKQNGTDANGKILYDTTVKNTFENISLTKLWCVSKDTMSYDAPIGLMIGSIASGSQVIFDGITMSDYADGDVTDGKKAASALIGMVGGKNATDISVRFENMDIADAAAGKSSVALHSSKQDEVLEKASLIYSYDYSDNCNAIYTFTYVDYRDGRCNSAITKKITLGTELGNNEESPNYALEEYFDLDMPVGQMKDGDTGIDYDCNNYIPYVYTGTKHILVNPKVGNLDTGCGTYEDPYVITSAKQLMSLYRYLYDEENFTGVLSAGPWKINKTGDDSRLCDKTNTVDAGHGTAISYMGTEEDNEFPTKEQLSQAYYEIDQDIDLSGYSEFTGFGRSNLPFTGVFVGKKTTENPVIVMSKISNPVENYGFVQTAKGCVLKNLTLQFNQPVQINQVKTVEENGTWIQKNEGGVGGGAIGTVLGGENVLDHIKVCGHATGTGAYIESFTPVNTRAQVGGYVGVVNAGGVIIRNMPEDCLSAFNVSLLGTSPIGDYVYTCVMIGRVLDGYVVYDQKNDGFIPLLKDMQDVCNNSLTVSTNGLSRSYDILNGAYFAGSKIEWQIGTGYGLADARQLQLLSMAMNAGMLNYDSSDTELTGYNKISRQRYGNYDYVGEVTDAAPAAVEARNGVILHDNMNQASSMAYGSYLSQYFTWDENSILSTENGAAFDGTNGTCILNPEGSVLTYTLSGVEYDMTVYGNAFRGLGARYNRDKNYFHGNLMGKDGSSVICLNMEVDGIQDAEDAALLNKVQTSTAQELRIANITLKGKIVNHEDIGEDTISTIIDEHYAAGFITQADNVTLTFDNVLLKELEIDSQNYAGGMVSDNIHTKNQPVTLNNCGMDNVVVKGRNDAGGFIGTTQNTTTVTGIKSLQTVSVESTANKGRTNQGQNAGGIIGSTQGAVTINGVTDDSSQETVTGNNIIVRTNGMNVQVGGLIGKALNTGKQYKISNVKLLNLTVENTYQGEYWNPGSETKGVNGIGGIIGSTNGIVTFTNLTIGNTDEDQKTTIQNTNTYYDNTNIPEHNTYCTGGMIGRHLTNTNTLTINGCKVLGVRKADDTYTTVISGMGSNVAGMIGNSYTFKGEDIEVRGVLIKAVRYAGGIIGWVESGKTCQLKKVVVKDVKISLFGQCGSSVARGDVGGVVGHAAGAVQLSGAQVDSLIVESDYVTCAGGFVGNVVSNNLQVQQYNNSSVTIKNEVKNASIGGRKVGGMVGQITDGTTMQSMADITISGNKLIASREEGNDNYTDMVSGGLVGLISVSKAASCIKAENITISENLIAAYNQYNHAAKLGGVLGSNQSESYFYHVILKDNNIGMLKKAELTDQTDSTSAVTSADRKEFLRKTSISKLRDMLYCVTSTTTDLDKKVCDAFETDADGKPEYYKYSYYQGAIVGSVENSAVNTSDIGIVKFIDVNIQYTDSKYRPVADVGTASQNLSSNTAMYEEYRAKCAIVYDGGAATNTKISNISETFPELGTDLGNPAVPYVFAGMEDIMTQYQSATEEDIRNAYRLDDNYQNKETINQDSSVDNYEKICAKEVYQDSYKDDEGYKSPFKRDGKALPMVVYHSTEHGTLNQVLQTYINILTNNSGGLDSYVNHSKSSVYTILAVKAYKMNLKDGQLSMDTSDDASVVVTPDTSGNNPSYQFTAGSGDDYVSQTEGTFSMVHVEYGWKKGNANETKWVLDIPVYVEKRLKLYSNMKMLEGIEYNTETLKTKGAGVVSANTGARTALSLTRGNSYSIYTEYIYENTEKFSSVVIPKTFGIQTDNNVDVTFRSGTQITLVALDEAGKAYYYKVDNDSKKQIDFTDFKDADGNAYELKDMKKTTAKTSYTDVCDTTYENDVQVERFVLLVDTSGVEGSASEKNKLYEMHILPEHISDVLKNRTDYEEHCYEYVNEIPGAVYQINTDSRYTSLDAASSIGEDGWIKAKLQYDITASVEFWQAIQKATEKKYVDVGFYLAAENTDHTYEKLLLPTGTGVFFGNDTDQISIPITQRQSTIYYYQSRRKQTAASADAVCLNQLAANTSNGLQVMFDFANADLTELEAYRDRTICLVAELVVTEDEDMPASGEVKDIWRANVTMQTTDDIGFALEVTDLKTLGMNQYDPEESDSGVVSYTANVAFPETDFANAQSKDYTIVYEIEEKTSQKGSDGKPEYKTYTGSDVSLYLGSFETVKQAKEAYEETTDGVRSGKGITAVTYHFDSSDMQAMKQQGMVLADGMKQTTASDQATPGILTVHQTLVANCSGLEMTNYRIKAYLVVTDASGSTANEQGYMKNAVRRTQGWAVASIGENAEYKDDFFVFTVAKIKTSLK